MAPHTAPEHLFIPGFNVHPSDFALISRAAELHHVPLPDFVQLATYSYARDLLQVYATAQALTAEDSPFPGEAAETEHSFLKSTYRLPEKR